MDIAVLFLIFNRPDLTAQSFAAIRAARPARLYIAADGPRSGRPGEEERCREARAVAMATNWPCEVKTMFRKRNLGCKTACSSAMDWFFGQEPEGVVIEDDCVAHPDFFPYCKNLLERYRDDARVMFISGSNFEFGKKRGPGSYYFSIFPHVWGWAAWARTWKTYDVNMQGVERFIKTRMPGIVGHMGAYRVMMQKFLLVAQGLDDTWDFQMVYNVWRHSGLCVIPNVNMVRNIGWVEESAHAWRPDIRMHRTVEGLPQITHPDLVAADLDAQLFACECLTAEGKGMAATLFTEGLKRLNEGDAAANRELLRAAREFYGPEPGFLGLEALTALALGDMASARHATDELRTVASDDAFLPDLERLLAGKATVVPGTV